VENLPKGYKILLLDSSTTTTTTSGTLPCGISVFSALPLLSFLLVSCLFSNFNANNFVFLCLARKLMAILVVNPPESMQPPNKRCQLRNYTCHILISDAKFPHSSHSTHSPIPIPFPMPLPLSPLPFVFARVYLLSIFVTLSVPSLCLSSRPVLPPSPSRLSAFTFAAAHIWLGQNVDYLVTNSCGILFLLLLFMTINCN